MTPLPLENVTHTENGVHPAACKREGYLVGAGEKGYLRLIGHSWDRSPAVVTIDVSKINLDSHRSL